jgi:hypothetical protein
MTDPITDLLKAAADLADAWTPRRAARVGVLLDTIHSDPGKARAAFKLIHETDHTQEA